MTPLARYLTLATAVLALVAPVRGAEEEEEPKDTSCGFRQKIAAGMSLKEVLEKGSDMVSCAEHSGFSFMTAQFLPDDDEAAKMCHSEDCRGIIEAIENSDPPDCDLHIYGLASRLNFYALVDKVQTVCGNITSGSGSSASGDDDDDDNDDNDDNDDDKDDKDDEKAKTKKDKWEDEEATERKLRLA